MKAVMLSWDEKIMQPLKGFLFGKENAKKSLLKNFGDTFNKLLFGSEKASKQGLWKNIKEGIVSITKKITDPITDWFKNKLFPSFKGFVDAVKKE